MSKLRHFPVTLGAVLLMWVLRCAFAFNTGQLRDSLGFGLEARSPWWTVFTSATTVATWHGAILSTFAVLLVGGFVELKLGSLRYGLGAVAFHLVGLGLGVALAWLLTDAGLYWGDGLEQERVLSPFLWLCGITMFATGQMSPLWRHRLRALFIALTFTLILYAGITADYAFFSAAMVGLLLGQWRSGRGFGIHVASIRERRILAAIVLLTVFSGPWLSGMNPDASGPFADVSFFILPQLTSEQAGWLCEDNSSSEACIHAMWQLRSSGIGPMLANLLPLVVTAFLALGLVRGRRIAMRYSLLALASALVALGFELYKLDLAQPLLWLYLGLPWIGCALMLIALRQLFQVTLSPVRRRQFYGALATWWLITAAVWMIGGTIVFKASLFDLLKALPLRYIPPVVAKFFSFDVLPLSPAAWVLTEWVGIVFWVGFLVLFGRLIRLSPDPGLDSDRDTAREMLARGTGDHLSWMTLWPGNRYWFGHGGYVAYRLHNGIAVTVGEPVCSGSTPAQLADAFEHHIYGQGCHVAWYSVRSFFADTRQEWQRLPVAEESVIDVVDEPAFKGKKFQDVRTAKNRATKEGIHAEWTTWADCSIALRNQITALSEEWVSEKSLPEMGFTLGGLPELDDPQVKLMLAVAEDGTLQGVTSWLPAQDGIVLDFMRRRADGFRPVVEFLIAVTLERAHEEGLKWVSLSGAPLAVEGVGMLGQALERVGSALEPLYGFRSLAAFKKKFGPRHESWLLLYRDELTLPAIGMAVSKCYVPMLGSEVRRMALKPGALRTVRLRPVGRAPKTTATK